MQQSISFCHTNDFYVGGDLFGYYKDAELYKNDSNANNNKW